MAFHLISRALPVVSRAVAHSGFVQIRLASTAYRKSLPSFSMEGKVNIICEDEGNVL